MTQPRKINLKGMLKYAKTTYNNHTQKAGDNCPPSDKLLDYVYRDDVADDDGLTEEERGYISNHLKHCERCSVEQLKMDVERIKHELMLNIAFDSLLSEGAEQITPPWVHSAISLAFPTGTERNGNPAAADSYKTRGEYSILDANTKRSEFKKH